MTPSKSQDKMKPWCALLRAFRRLRPKRVVMSTTTSTTLLSKLRDQENHSVWNDFCSRYTPLLVGFAQRLGLDHHDAQDAAQAALCAFAIAYRDNQYHRDRGGLRTWLFRIAANKVRDIQRLKRKDRPLGQASGTDLFDRIPDDHTLSCLWDAQWQRAIARQAIRQVRGEVELATFQAFALTFLKEWPNERAAEKLGMTANAVSKAKRRVLSRLGEIRGELEQDW